MEIANRPQVDAEAGTLMAQVMERHRAELVGLLGNPPNYDNVPLAFWQKIRREYEQEVAAILLLVFMESARRHGYFAVAGENDTVARTQALLWAGNQSRATAQQITLTTMERVEQAVADTERLDEAMDSIFGPDRAEAIAEDQVTAAQSAGGEWSIANTVGKSLADTWYTEADSWVCPICAPLHETTRATWETAFPSGPPAHPRCRCWIVYDNLKEQG